MRSSPAAGCPRQQDGNLNAGQAEALHQGHQLRPRHGINAEHHLVGDELAEELALWRQKQLQRLSRPR